jgi:hypothetical protein
MMPEHLRKPTSDIMSHQNTDTLPLDVDQEQYRRRMRDPGIAEEAAEIAAAVADIEAAEVAESVIRRRLRPLEIVMLALLTASLLVHALTLSQLFRVRNTLRGQIEQLAAGVEAAKAEQVRYDLPIDQQVPIDLDVPIKRSLSVPIRTEVRIQQQINVPIDTGVAGLIEIPIPIDTTVPVSTTVPIDFDQTVSISTTVPLRLNVPIQIDLGAPQLSGYLDRLHAALLKLRDEL